MKVSRKDSRSATMGPEDWFTGAVALLPMFGVEAPSRMAGNSVTFAAGARTHWHRHPLGQTIIITDGICRTQREGGPVEVLHPGDVARFAPGERHWHGAGTDGPMTHIAVQESVDGVAVEWLDPVTDADYDS